MKAFWKALKFVGEWLLRFLWLGLYLFSAAQRVAVSNDPERAATTEFAFLAATVALFVLLALASRFFKTRLSEPAFQALSSTTINSVGVVIGIIWLMVMTFGSWPDMIAAFRSGDAPRILLARATPLVQPMAIIAVVGGVAWFAEARLRGDVRLAARIGLAALLTFWVVVLLPATVNRQAGQPLFDRGMILALILWLGMVLPALGVFVAYRRIGDGRT